MALEQKFCIQRRERLLAQVNADWLVISNPLHIHYFSGYWVTPLHLGSHGAPHLLIDGRSGRTTLMTHNFAANVQSAFVDEIQSWHWYDAVSAPDGPLFPSMTDELAKHLQGRIAAEKGLLPQGSLPGEWTDLTPFILVMRRAKDPDELAQIRRAIRAVEAGHRAARLAIRPGVTELGVYSAIFAAIVMDAGEPVLPLCDLVSGPRAFAIGGPPTDRVIQPGDVMIADIFPVIGGYRADFTATYAASDQLTPQQQSLETALHAALEAGEQQMRPGASASAIYQAVKQALDERGFTGNFPHHAGHGLGLGHPEAPFLVADSNETLVEGDIITLEPGAYGPDFGGRIEHDYLITADGFERLTHHDTRFLG